MRARAQMICHCGLTILDPPIPCGTRLRCPHPCARPPPACGHPRSPHACHADDTGGCPPCPFLTTKLCACGKRRVDNVRCAQARERVGCGGACGRLLGCGFHVCERLCHGGECGPCAQVCGKPRKLWCVSPPSCPPRGVDADLTRLYSFCWLFVCLPACVRAARPHTTPARSRATRRRRAKRPSHAARS